MVGGTPLSPPLGGGAVVPPVLVLVPVDMAVGAVVGGTVVGARTVGAVAGGNAAEVWWVVLELGRV